MESIWTKENLRLGFISVDDMLARIEVLDEALRSVVADIEDYERVNNLSPSPGKRDCWQSVTHAKVVLFGK